MYLAGFGNHHQTEAMSGALPKDQNSPQQCPFGLYAEQLSGSAFTRPRHVNLHSWLYRTAPSVVHQDYVLYKNDKSLTFADLQSPNPYRWSVFPPAKNAVDFVDGLFHIAGNQVVNAYIYQCNASMQNRFFSNRDGEMLLVPYEGELILFTEFGRLTISPGKIAVIPRGVTFKVELTASNAAGYLCENQGLPLTIPHLGVIGANGLANPRHFIYPKAAFENINAPMTLLCKYQHHVWSSNSNHSPLNVVAWHGNYAPYSYDLSLFNTINTVSFDHPDPSIFTVLTSESDTPGVANLDFVIFPPRWMVAEHTFRPPYFHRNIMSELMGLITGEYDAKKEGFMPGGISIHNCMTAHGPDSSTYNATIADELKPVRYDNTLAFMFETREPWNISKEALAHDARQQEYSDCWQNLAIYGNEIS
ncbi:MAG: homogentisate 1,2-dioxygenase [Legionella sp.]|nr:homogentisate 1,2-dioxygenase [Legionella sp.]